MHRSCFTFVGFLFVQPCNQELIKERSAICQVSLSPQFLIKNEDRAAQFSQFSAFISLCALFKMLLPLSPANKRSLCLQQKVQSILFIQGKIAIMNVRLDLKALDFIRKIDFSLIGKKGRGGGGERNEKEISNKNVPRPLIHEFSFCLLSLNNFPLTFLIEYCKWKKQINISPWLDLLSVMLFMIFFLLCQWEGRCQQHCYLPAWSDSALHLCAKQAREKALFHLHAAQTGGWCGVLKCTLNQINAC